MKDNIMPTSTPVAPLEAEPPTLPLARLAQSRESGEAEGMENVLTLRGRATEENRQYFASLPYWARPCAQDNIYLFHRGLEGTSQFLQWAMDSTLSPREQHVRARHYRAERENMLHRGTALVQREGRLVPVEVERPQGFLGVLFWKLSAGLRHHTFLDNYPLTSALILMNVLWVFLVYPAQFSMQQVWLAREHPTLLSALTSAFTHAGLLHLLMNMMALRFVGKLFERRVGSWAFALIYFSGLLGAALGFLLLPSTSTLGGNLVGASGAISGVLGLLVPSVFLDAKHDKSGGKLGLVIMLALNVGLVFLVPSISWQAHLGGFLVGVPMSLLLWPRSEGEWRKPLRGARGCWALLLGVLVAGVLLGVLYV